MLTSIALGATVLGFVAILPIIYLMVRNPQFRVQGLMGIPAALGLGASFAREFDDNALFPVVALLTLPMLVQFIALCASLFVRCYTVRMFVTKRGEFESSMRVTMLQTVCCVIAAIGCLWMMGRIPGLLGAAALAMNAVALMFSAWQIYRFWLIARCEAQFGLVNFALRRAYRFRQS